MTTSETTERQVLAKCLGLLRQMKRHGEPICWRKVHGNGMSRRGEPDLDITYFGRSVKVELKRPGRQPTRLQAHRLSEWSVAGAVTGCVDSSDSLAAMLAAVKKMCGHIVREETRWDSTGTDA